MCVFDMQQHCDAVESASGFVCMSAVHVLTA